MQHHHIEQSALQIEVYYAAHSNGNTHSFIVVGIFTLHKTLFTYSGYVHAAVVQLLC